MGGFFGLFDYNKEGPGVYLNEPEKGPVKTFFSILGRKFWKIVTVNMMYVVFSIPAIIVAVLFSTYILPVLIPQSWAVIVEGVLSTDTRAAEEAVSQDAAILIILTLIVSMLLIGIQLIVFGPVHAGITVIFRNYAREEHAFLWGDFKDTFVKNWKQSLVTPVISILIIAILSISLSFYASGDVVTNSFLKGMFTGFVLIIGLLFLLMHIYIYPMMITFNVTMKQLYKNSFLLAIGKLPMNILMMLISIFILIVLPGLILLIPLNIAPIMFIAYYMFFAFGINLMVVNFYAYRQLEKYMIGPSEGAGDKKEDKLSDEAVFSDTTPEEDNE